MGGRRIKKANQELFILNYFDFKVKSDYELKITKLSQIKKNQNE